MRIDWLDDLVALLDSGGVADAARLRHVTQPAFSRRIKVLEDTLGLEIIDRSVKPSGPSRVLRDHEAELRKLAAEQKLLISDMRQEHKSGHRQIVIASQHAITTSLGPRIINSISEPDQIHIRLRSGNRDECETLLIRRQAGIALTYHIKSEPLPEPPSFLTEAVIGAERLIPVCGSRFAETIRTEIHSGLLRMIGYPTDVFLGAALTRHVLPTLEDRCSVSIVTETALSPAALHLAASGLGVAWVPLTLAQPDLDRGDLTHLEPDLGGIEMDLVAHRWTNAPQATVLDAWDRLTNALF